MAQDARIWDVAVVGAGLAGGIVAAQLGTAGRDVLVLEAGPAARAGRWPGALQLVAPGRRARTRPAVLGHGLGGSAALYGAALTRLRRTDLECDRRGAAGEAVLPNAWPLDYDALAADYARAETLLGVRGGRDPGDPDPAPALPLAPSVCPRDAHLAADLAANGHAPFRLPVGLSYLPGCSECQGAVCGRGCKADGASRALRPALAAGQVTLQSGALVTRVGRTAGAVTLEATGPDGARTYRARRVVLAAGALSTPRILMNSPDLWPAAPPAVLGRGLMFHISDLFAVTDRRGGAVHGPLKTTCLRDFYEVDGQPLGEIQSLGLAANAGLVRRYLEEEAAARGAARLGRALPLVLAPIAALAARRFAGAAVFATILEDLPRAENRVLAGEGAGPIRLAYAATPELVARCRRMRDMARAAFAPNRVRFLSRPATPNWGHPLGTCRMGTDPASSVVGPDGALHGRDDIFVADASVMPSSAGTNPSLTIAALALRMADRLAAADTVAAA